MGEQEDHRVATDTTEVTGIESFGVKMYIGANRPEVIPRLPSVLPPGAVLAPVRDAVHRMAIIGNDHGTYQVNIDGAPFADMVPLDLALEVLEEAVHARVSLNAPDLIFVHAGAVAHKGRAILLPGPSFAGKTTLVAALVRAGATYYSDEFAPLDAEGRVHPYAKPLSLRGADLFQTDHAVETLGGVAGEEPLPVGLVVKSIYRAGATWAPRRIGPGAGALALLANTIPAYERPEQSMQAIARAIDGAVVLEGDRGEADEIAASLLAEVEGRAHAPPD
ncbi:MAG TPA: hypothetical protein VFZ89_01875, partial [Solirubrobacteraceae bacterium]